MKTKPCAILLIVGLILAGIAAAPGQSHSHRQSHSYGQSRSYGDVPVPGPEDYPAFAQFIALRNIFNPERYPHSTGRPPPILAKLARSAPSFSFVGTMVYDKGMFAFFDGNDDDYRKSLQAWGTIAGYTVRSISLTNVILAEGTNTFSLAVGGLMQRSPDGTWVQSGESIDFANSANGSPGATDASGTAGSGNTSAPPSAPAGQMSDVLKRLMLLRQQENK
jgi:hypothetical protein